jgi:hypothetical protein
MDGKIKRIFKKWDGVHELDWSGSEHGQVTRAVDIDIDIDILFAFHRSNSQYNSRI